ncbi:MAG TPA: Ig-like domain-containing protein [Prolixibacteraceae bacterium]|nr:Ig-like domain-containing protein [Prolixibacteraceae bacterium]
MIPLFLVWSCANMGMPKGGPKDKMPPFIVKSIPEANQTNFSENKIRITFNEFVIPEELSDKFIVSPPTTKKPIFKTKGKTFIVDLNEKLQPNTTYSLDFKDGIVDNNEKNKIMDLRLAFSTGPDLDSLRIVGFVRDAFNLEPAKNCYILLYKGTSDTLVIKTRPDFVGKTNSQGFFAISNLPTADFMLYALSDIDNNLKYTAGVDSIAFLSDRITPKAEYQPQRDTLITGADTLVVLGKTRFFPDPLNFSLFFEKGFDLSLDKYERLTRKTIDLTFTASTADTFGIELLNIKPKGPWNVIEKSRNADTLKIWITDSLVYKRDTLALQLSYLQQDSLGAFYTKKDTVKLYLTDDEANKPDKNKHKERRKIVTEPKSVMLSSSLGPILDPYRDIRIESPEPVLTFDTTKVGLFVKEDTTYVQIEPKFKPDSTNNRSFLISYPWKFGTSYRLSIDSTALTTIYGLYGKAFTVDFKAQEEEHYGKIIFDLKNVKGPTIIQILEVNKDENLVKSIQADKDQVITIPFLEPKKYLMKAIFDRNNNGKWDSGNLAEKIEPEEVCYYLSVLKVRSNWDNQDSWTLPDPTGFIKKIIDPDAEIEKITKKKKNTQKKSTLF